MRGEVHRMAPRGTRGHEQSGTRFAVVVQSDDPARLGPSVGYLSREEICRVNAAVRIVLEL
ncbi:hypothetical protein EAH80_14920 [Mycobacterium hodleri]|uniref:Type II toxin-antitoxin system PemK/MazF family toxin n=1 Tax=Mycolicibacterium hodleri TaxID=49897 RepID=A0A502EAV8_9MYCO|nr:hypothetical protein EAH80_14920 [Mycolicibacterium hodleri]